MVLGSYDTYSRSPRLEEWCPWRVVIELNSKGGRGADREKGREVIPGRGSEG